jgi:rhodanese-related sulfurtransferase
MKMAFEQIKDFTLGGFLPPLNVTAKDLQAQRAGSDGPAVIDVRSPMEFAAGHIPGAVNIPYEEIAVRITEVEAPHGVALYCMKGPRARLGETALQKSGYAGSVLHVEGGFSAWKALGLPIER